MQPTIPVKKTDGTTVRMTPTEFQAYQRGLKKTEEHAAPTTANTMEDFVAHAASEFHIAKEFEERLRSLVASRVKEVRTDDQFMALAMTPTHRGGTGLSPDDAHSLLTLLKRTFNIKEAGVAKRAPLRASPPEWRPVTSLAPRSENAPAMLPSATPVPSLPPAPVQNVEARVSRPRPLIQDVTMPQKEMKRSVGPMEEFANFSLIDFRRLGATPDAAVSRVKEKFETLKTESYLLFLQARDAWFGSPLFSDYAEAVRSSLAAGKRLAETLAEARNQNRMTMEVFLGIANINMSLRV